MDITIWQEIPIRNIRQAKNSDPWFWAQASASARRLYHIRVQNQSRWHPQTRRVVCPSLYGKQLVPTAVGLRWHSDVGKIFFYYSHYCNFYALVKNCMRIHFVRREDSWGDRIDRSFGASVLRVLLVCALIPNAFSRCDTFAGHANHFIYINFKSWVG